ncbi:MAG: GH92 family glycosyl hydrolase [Bacteroidales bacterium]|nr:GH92 family glycosyl hydrolase [Candidatus Sodaliphilus aphodohippi]
MKKIILLATMLLSVAVASARVQSPVDCVNPLIGASENGDGGTSPFVSPPYAMTNFTAQTWENRIGDMPYYYEDPTIIGFLATHQPSVWMGDYGYVSLMPQTGKDVKTAANERAMKFSHKDEKATPYRYSVVMQSNEGKVKGEITASARCALMRFTFPGKGMQRIIVQGINLDPSKTDFCNRYDRRLKTLRGWMKVVPEKNEIIGYNPDRQSDPFGPEMPNFNGYFVIRFDKPIKGFGTWSDNCVYRDKNEQTGTRMGAFAEFDAAGKAVTVQVATSFISIEQARENLAKEVPGWDMEQLATTTRNAWNKVLGNLTVEGATPDQAAIFYTALYHNYQLPREMGEYGRYYSAMDDKIHEGNSYNDFSLWDTFRCTHPLLTLLEPKLTGDFITALLQMYREGGWLPMWPNPSYTNVMIGTHSDVVIADAYMKGIRNYDVNLAYEAMRKDAMLPPDGDTQRRFADRDQWEGFEGRAGASYYHSLGYIPYDRTAESVSRTLEYALDDWCIAQVAQDLGKTDDYNKLMNWSQNYRNVYNKEKGFMLPRDFNGNWKDLDDNGRVGLTEGSKWTYLFCVMQDVPGMIEMMGGNEAFKKKLDQNFEGGYYRHDNEPGHHYIYLYDYCGAPRKCQELVRKHTRINYRNAPDGLNGNDDCGQMSAWYLFSVMGSYPVTPASNIFALGAPQFPRITMQITSGDGKDTHPLVIEARNISETNMYVDHVEIDGKRHEGNFITYAQLLAARNITFFMTK